MRKIHRWMAVIIVFGLGQASAFQAIDTSFHPPTLAKDSQLAELAHAYAPERMGTRPAPRFGLALSGGGTRAAYFALGVMAGLNDSGALDHVDAISSVSGGTYAALWLYSKRYLADQERWDYHDIFRDCFPAWIAQPENMVLKAQHRPFNRTERKMWEARESETKTDKNPVLRRFTDTCEDRNTVHYYPADPKTHRVEDPYVWQAYLARWPNLMDPNPTRITGDPQDPFTLFTVDNFVKIYGARLLGRRASREWYENGIRRVWWQAPEPRHYPDAGATAEERVPWSWSYRAGLSLSTFDQLQEFTRDNTTVPFWIINANVGHNHHEPNFGHIFEMTPYAYGSGETNYAVGHLPDVDLLKAVELSSAFLDGQNAAVGTTDHFGLVAAQWITLGDLSWGQKVATPGLKPRPFGWRYRLSDGGGEENLGLYSLVRRGVRHIIVVDGEQDAPGKLDGLCRNWEALRVSGWHLDITNLQSLGDMCHDEASGKPDRGYNTSVWLNQVMRGVIVPDRDKDATPGSAAMADRESNTIELLYIKLGWNEPAYRHSLNAGDCETQQDDLSCFLTIYYAENGQYRNRKDGWIVFPQLTTAGMTIHATSYQFWAFRELGREAGRRIHWDAVGQSILTPDERTQTLVKLAFPSDDRARAVPNCDSVQGPKCPGR